MTRLFSLTVLLLSCLVTPVLASDSDKIGSPESVELLLKAPEVLMSSDARKHLLSGAESGGEPSAVELRWSGGNAWLPDGSQPSISLHLRFVPGASFAISPTNQMTTLERVSGYLVVRTSDDATNWQIEQDNYRDYFAKAHWWKSDDGTKPIAFHLPVAFVRDRDQFRVVGHIFLAFADEQLTFKRAWIEPRLGGNPESTPALPTTVFNDAPSIARNRSRNAGAPWIVNINAKEGGEVRFTEALGLERLTQASPKLTDCDKTSPKGTTALSTVSVNSKEAVGVAAVALELTPGPSRISNNQVYNLMEDFRGVLKVRSDDTVKDFAFARKHRGEKVAYSVYDLSGKHLTISAPIEIYVDDETITADMTVGCALELRASLVCGSTRIESKEWGTFSKHIASSDTAELAPAIHNQAAQFAVLNVKLSEEPQALAALMPPDPDPGCLEICNECKTNNRGGCSLVGCQTMGGGCPSESGATGLLHRCTTLRLQTLF